MNAKEINEQVARKLGWEHPEHSSKYWHNPADDDQLYDAVPDYAGSIQAAWEIVPKLKKWSLSRTGEGDYVLAFSAFDALVYDSIVADTAPLAICLAFLKLP